MYQFAIRMGSRGLIAILVNVIYLTFIGLYFPEKNAEKGKKHISISDVGFPVYCKQTDVREHKSFNATIQSSP